MSGKAKTEKSSELDASTSRDAELGNLENRTPGEAIQAQQKSISKAWRIDRAPKLPNYEELAVTLRVTLDQSGRIVGAPEPVSPSSPPDVRFKIAFDVARIALMPAQPFKLPPADRDSRKSFDATFDPRRKGVLVRF